MVHSPSYTPLALVKITIEIVVKWSEALPNHAVEASAAESWSWDGVTRPYSKLPNKGQFSKKLFIELLCENSFLQTTQTLTGANPFCIDSLTVVNTNHNP